LKITKINYFKLKKIFFFKNSFKTQKLKGFYYITEKNTKKEMRKRRTVDVNILQENRTVQLNANKLQNWSALN
jgi:hypothetical protein